MLEGCRIDDEVSEKEEFQKEQLAWGEGEKEDWLQSINQSINQSMRTEK